MKIRQAGPADIPAIVDIGRRTRPSTYAFAGPGYITTGLATWWSPEAVARSLTDTTVLVTDDLTGIGNIDLRGSQPTIWKLYVLPEAQGTGAGTALLHTLIPYAQGKPIRLEYTDGNHRAAGFYAANGFTEIAREPSNTAGWPDTIWLERP